MPDSRSFGKIVPFTFSMKLMLVVRVSSRHLSRRASKAQGVVSPPECVKFELIYSSGPRI